MVEGKTSTTRHDGIPAVSESVGIDVPQIRCVCGQCLLRHSHPLRAMENDQLRGHRKMGLHEESIPGGRPCPHRKRLVGWGRRTEMRIVRTVLVIDRHVELADVKVSKQARTIKRLIT